MVTYNRPGVAQNVIRQCVDQSLAPSHVIVVDSGDIPFEAESLDLGNTTVEVIRPGANIGPAGGIPLAAQRLAEIKGDGPHYVVLLDDDDPFVDLTCVERAVEALKNEKLKGRTTAGVGYRGAMFNLQQMRATKPTPDGKNLTSVDSLHGGFCAVYHLEALIGIPVWIQDLFWGFEELAMGLHINRSIGGLLSFEDPTVIGEEKSARIKGRPHLTYQEQPSLRRYYTLRNLLIIEQHFGKRGVALKHGLVRGVLKPLAVMPLQPRWAMRALAYGFGALTHGLRKQTPHMGSPASCPRALNFLQKTGSGKVHEV